MTKTLIDFFNLEDEDFDWRKIASCVNYDDPELFFEVYEGDRITAANTDQICLNCPVIRQCFRQGFGDRETGLWGGVYLENGKVSRDSNSHKKPETWKRLSALHGRKF